MSAVILYIMMYSLIGAGAVVIVAFLLGAIVERREEQRLARQRKVAEATQAWLDRFAPRKDNVP